MVAFPENRQSNRKAVQFQVVFDDEEIFQTGATVNLSSGGILVETPTPRTVGTRLRIIPMVNGDIDVLDLSAEVRRVEEIRQDQHSLGRMYRMGLMLFPTEQAQQTMQQLAAF